MENRLRKIKLGESRTAEAIVIMSAAITCNGLTSAEKENREAYNFL